MTIRVAVALTLLVAVAACRDSSQFTGPPQPFARGDCGGASAASPGPGSVNLSIQTAGLCLAGGASGADFALIAFNAAATQGGSATVTVTAQNAASLSTADRRAAALVPVQFAGGLQPALALRYRARDTLEARLRKAEAAAVGPRIASARAWMRQRSTGALRDAIPRAVRVGDLLRLNANESDPCSNPQIRTGRVAAISNLAIVVADTSNPPGGFTDADYASFGAQFDTLVYPLDTANFGAPTDIDQNGREVIFFTRAVNALTAPGSGSLIGGFFFERDLLDQKSCPTSNLGEMFYMLVPDPDGVVNGNHFVYDDVKAGTLPTLAHEFQHLINFGRRTYINNASGDEAIWLNEGLSHIAEELLFYRQTGLSPRRNIDLATLQQSQMVVDAFNNDQNPNFTRYQSYLASPSTSSVYAEDDDLNDRGAIWGFLRWAADHQGASDRTVWRALVNSTTTGLDNLKNVFGPDVMQQIRDYTTSVFADDVPGVTEPRAQQPSWNERSITSFFQSSYPLQVHPLASGVPASATLDGGGSAYFRFTVAPGQTASITWTSTSGGGVNWALVRSR